MRRVLVVDDDEAVRVYLHEVLAAHGYETALTETAPQALATQVSFRPHVVLLDVVMPGMTGIEIVETLIAIDPGVTVIVMTAYPNDGSALQAIELGARDYLVKPFDWEQLKTLIEVYAVTDHGLS